MHRLRLLIILCVVVIAGLTFGYIFAAYQSLPTVGNNMRPAVSSQVFDIHGRLVTTLHSDQNRLPIDINKVPQHLQNAFIAAEDNRFYDHIGIDPIGIGRAIVTNITSGGIAQGGSTITQQLAKNAFLSQEQTLKRKIQEAMLALEIERKYSKKEILEMYMNQIYFGQGAYGGISGCDVRKISPSAEKGLDIAFFACRGYGVTDESRNGRKIREIVIYDFLRIPARDFKPLGQSER